MPAYLVDSEMKQESSDECFYSLWTSICDDEVSTSALLTHIESETIKMEKRQVEKTGQWMI